MKNIFSKTYSFMPNNMFPSCNKHAGGEVFYSNPCVCLMSDGSYEINRYIMDDDKKDLWNTQGDLTVEAWMELGGDDD